MSAEGCLEGVLKGCLEERQNAEKDVERNGVSAAIVRYVMCDEIEWKGSETVAEVVIYDGSEIPNSLTS